jgi:hypothetical protein
MFVILETPSGYLQEHCSDKLTLTLHLKQKICLSDGENWPSAADDWLNSGRADYGPYAPKRKQVATAEP